MADLVPRHQIAELTRLLDAPYLNSFGATETGLPPASGSVIQVGVTPTDLAKRISSFCEIRLVDPLDNDVPVGRAKRGPTLFRATGMRWEPTPPISEVACPIRAIPFRRLPMDASISLVE
jgi:hypothetical protein